MGTYLTPVAPTSTTGMLMKAQTRMLVGTGRLYSSLVASGWAYSTYTVSIGLQAGQFFDIGTLESLTFTHQPSYEAIESYNVGDDSLYEVTGEETMVSVGIRQFDYRMLELAIGTGSKIDVGSESFIPFGGGCTMLRRPYSFEFLNDSCFAPSSADISLGVTGGAITLYDCFIQSGLEWAMAAKESNTIPLEVQALPVLTLASGRRLGIVYLY